MGRICLKCLLTASAVALIVLSPVAAMAEGAYKGYIYDNQRYIRHSINGYLYKDCIDGFDLSVGPLKQPEDIYVANDDTIYIADTGNNRIIRMDMDKNVLSIYGREDGKVALKEPNGVFVTGTGLVYVADTGNKRIVVFDNKGDFVKEYTKPESPLIGNDFNFSPSKLVVDRRGYMYVVVKGSYQGLMQIDEEGKFKGFFGANRVKFDLNRFLIRIIATKEQKEQIARERPPFISNVFLDEEGFIYTTTVGIRTNQLKRLSAAGVDTLNFDERNSKRYGDLRMPVSNWIPMHEAFSDITVDSAGIITAVDEVTGRAYQYDKLGNLLFIFAGLGEQKGLNKSAAGIAQTSDGTVYIVDKIGSRINIYYKTPFCQKVHQATRLYVEGYYEEAYEPWKDVLRMNSNYDIAYLALGKSAYRAGYYNEAMEYYRLARSNYDYSVAFQEFRKEFVRKYFVYIIAGLFSAIIIKRVIGFFGRKNPRQPYLKI